MFDELAAQIRSMMEADAGPDHLAALNGLLETTQTLQSQFAVEDETSRQLKAAALKTEEDLRAEFGSRDQRIAELLGAIDRATASYRQAILAASPDLPAELIAGTTIEEIDASAQTARQIVDQIRQKESDRAQSEQVPTGAPARGQPDTSGMSPLEKIRAGLAAR